MGAGLRPGPNAKNKDCIPKLVETLNRFLAADDALKDCLCFLSVRIPHATQIRNAEHPDNVSLAERSPVNILSFNGRAQCLLWVESGHSIMSTDRCASKEIRQRHGS
jgi:hypothetical protein